jgi:hypothetical protein
MTHEEASILAFLESNREVYFARREIARKAMKRSVFEENPHWADAPLASLLLQDLVDQNENGQIRCKDYTGGRKK